ncbi:helix-turn-helix transcriptional regulator [Acidisoma silvae]|uniref:Response regulator transcription factor n=1 Tax=Acidisoma silvae TaxID=2802396 RepID=A0A964E1S6_9PROT|nr:response regulator transcription factor [Acidisoma silvae]MCB8878088.1 response regulator transcription factor [Acidisoma silvae]
MLRIAVIHGRVLARECLSQVLMPSPRDHWTVETYVSVSDAFSPDYDPPDVALIYVGSGAKEVIQKISETIRKYDSTKFMIFVDETTEAVAGAARCAIDCGAHGFFSTADTGVRMLRSAVEFVANGGAYVPTSLLLDTSTNPSQAMITRLQNSLTVRQSEVLACIKQGKPNKVIAHELGMSESTVKIHVRNILQQLGAINRTQAVFLAY